MIKKIPNNIYKIYKIYLMIIFRVNNKEIKKKLINKLNLIKY
jgi:hypothetical protein